MSCIHGSSTNLVCEICFNPSTPPLGPRGFADSLIGMWKSHYDDLQKQLASARAEHERMCDELMAKNAEIAGVQRKLDQAHDREIELIEERSRFVTIHEAELAAKDAEFNRSKELNRKLANHNADYKEALESAEAACAAYREALQWIDTKCSLASDPAAWPKAHRALKGTAGQALLDERAQYKRTLDRIADPTPSAGRPPFTAEDLRTLARECLHFALRGSEDRG